MSVRMRKRKRKRAFVGITLPGHAVAIWMVEIPCDLRFDFVACLEHGVFSDLYLHPYVHPDGCI